MKILSNINNDLYSEVSKILTKGIDKNVHFIRHYKKLANDFMSAQECYNYYRGCFIDGVTADSVHPRIWSPRNKYAKQICSPFADLVPPD